MSTKTSDTASFFHDLAKELSALLTMPVKLEKVGSQVRCLELRLTFADGVPVHVNVAFRTDDDRQGEDGSMTLWPPRNDPRTPLVLPSLLHGLTSKIRHYHVPGARGYTPAIRTATTFVRSRGYPTRWWARNRALALLRQGTSLHCLPRMLREILHSNCSNAPALGRAKSATGR